jgi:hypothetical protein
MAVTAKADLPRAMLIDTDDTIPSAYGRPEVAWNTIANEFAGELSPPQRRAQHQGVCTTHRLPSVLAPAQARFGLPDGLQIPDLDRSRTFACAVPCALRQPIPNSS